MTVVLAAVAVWFAALAFLLRAMWRAHRSIQTARHIREAIELTEPIGPEDRDDWGMR